MRTSEGDQWWREEVGIPGGSQAGIKRTRAMHVISIRISNRGRSDFPYKFKSRTNIAFVVKVTILVLIEWSYWFSPFC